MEHKMDDSMAESSVDQMVVGMAGWKAVLTVASMDTH